LKRHNQIHERHIGNSAAVTQEAENNSITELSDIILAEESIEGCPDHLETKILIDSNGQHYKIEMPPETDVGESSGEGNHVKNEVGNFYKMNYGDGSTIWMSEHNLNE